MKKIIVKDNHYLQDNIKYDRVTKILNIISDKGMDKLREVKGDYQADMILKKAGERGTQFHELAALYARGEMLDVHIEMLKIINPEMIARIEKFKIWFNASVDKVLLTEKTILDDKLKYGGTIDLVVIEKGNETATLIDLKSGTNISPKFRLQLGAYARLVETHTDIVIKTRKVIQVLPDKINFYEYRNKMSDFTLFNYALVLYREMGK